MIILYHQHRGLGLDFHRHTNGRLVMDNTLARSVDSVAAVTPFMGVVEVLSGDRGLVLLHKKA